MNHRFAVVTVTAVLGLATLRAWGQTPPATADPYANNPDAGMGTKTRRRTKTKRV